MNTISPIRPIRQLSMKLSLSVTLLLACILALICQAANAQQQDWRTSFVPLDPWRTIAGQTNYVRANGVQFCGTIVEVMPHGIRVEGEWGPLGTVYYPRNGWANVPVPPEYADYFITNYPYKAVAGGVIPSADRVMAWPAGNYTYKTVDGQLRTISQLDYGTPCGPNPLALAQIKEAAEKKRETEMRRVEFLEKDAVDGDSAAQYSLGFHYLHGIGCETNEALAIFWLTKAAQQGNIGASNDLQEIEGISVSASTNSASGHP